MAFTVLALALRSVADALWKLHDPRLYLSVVDNFHLVVAIHAEGIDSILKISED